ncbi:cell division protein FtsL [Pseudomethylobacillus aquaticus]|uniref:Cell division protein FtsL n=1 Tax=Pseudomethylobacillus aquaticus TaxID=2676064 RepID=A0A3N0UU94_9PROT|nr:cell division protein FtsL [Pseudomethylobacillus aquaticus]ROH84116.1 cell division protein FtsL [Pseudomethylobacillus aquaticus]
MTQFNLMLFGVLIMLSLATVAGQHQARKHYFELEQQQQAARQYEVEWGQLQLEQNTWATHARIEQIANQALKMRVPDNHSIQVVPATTGVQP